LQNYEKFQNLTNFSNDLFQNLTIYFQYLFQILIFYTPKKAGLLSQTSPFWYRGTTRYFLYSINIRFIRSIRVRKNSVAPWFRQNIILADEQQSIEKETFFNHFCRKIWEKSQKGVYLQRQKSQKGV